MFKNIINLLSNDIGIDLGTANTLVACRGKGIVLSEPSFVTVYKGTNEVFYRDGQPAIGRLAKEGDGFVPENLEVIRPMKDGVIANYEIAGVMLNYFIKKAQTGLSLIKPRLIIAVPSGSTQVEMNAVSQASIGAGVRDVFFIEEPMAGAIGAQMPVNEPHANMIVDIGGGTTEIAVITQGNRVASESLKIAGDSFDAAITDWLRVNHSLLIGPRTAEQLKIKMGSAAPFEQEFTMEVRGRSEQLRAPRGTTVTSDEIREALSGPVFEIIAAIKMVLERIPPEQSADLIDRGIVLTGGGALLPGLDQIICHYTQLPVRVADEPLLSVALGTAAVLEEIDVYKDALKSARDVA